MSICILHFFFFSFSARFNFSSLGKGKMIKPMIELMIEAELKLGNELYLVPYSNPEE